MGNFIKSLNSLATELRKIIMYECNDIFLNIAGRPTLCTCRKKGKKYMCVYVKDRLRKEAIPTHPPTQCTSILSFFSMEAVLFCVGELHKTRLRKTSHGKLHTVKAMYSPSDFSLYQMEVE